MKLFQNIWYINFQLRDILKKLEISMTDQPRKGSLDDAAKFAEILNKWVESTIWMPRLYSEIEILKMIEE